VPNVIRRLPRPELGGRPRLGTAEHALGRDEFVHQRSATLSRSAFSMFGQGRATSAISGVVLPAAALVCRGEDRWSSASAGRRCNGHCAAAATRCHLRHVFVCLAVSRPAWAPVLDWAAGGIGGHVQAEVGLGSGNAEPGPGCGGGSGVDDGGHGDDPGGGDGGGGDAGAHLGGQAEAGQLWRRFRGKCSDHVSVSSSVVRPPAHPGPVTLLAAVADRSPFRWRHRSCGVSPPSSPGRGRAIPAGRDCFRDFTAVSSAEMGGDLDEGDGGSSIRRPGRR
jgi:hypothetical protein